MSEPANQTKAALRQYRLATTLNDASKDALLARVLTSIEDGATGPALEQDVTPDVAQVVVLDRWRTAGRIAVALVGAAAVLLLVRVIHGGFVAGGQARTGRPEQAVYGIAEDDSGARVAAPREAAERTPPKPRAIERAPVFPADVAVPEAPAAPSPRPVPRAAPQRPQPKPKAPRAAPVASAADSLAEEMRMMARARAALAAGQPSDALAALKAHARRYPAGQMAEDRRALRARSLCAAGRNEAAAAAARAFVSAHPGSPHRGKVDAALQRAAEKKCGAS